MIYRQRGFSEAGDGYHHSEPWDIMDIESTIKSLGAEGWELVSAWPRSDYGGETNNLGGHIMGGMTTSEVWVFKRPLDSN